MTALPARHLLSLCLLALASGCAGQELEPTIESSARETSYAVAFPELLEQRRKQLVEDKTKASELTTELIDRDPKTQADPQLLEEIVQRSDAAGRSHSFVSAQREARAFRKFWEEERGPISQRVSAAAQKQISEGGCKDIEVSGATSYALKDGFERQLEKRVRAHNDAQQLIEQNRSALANGGYAEMQKLSDDVAYASYLVHVALIDDQRDIERMLSEQRRVSSTLQDSLQDERRYLSETAKTPQEKKGSEERIAALQKSQSTLDAAAKDADTEVKELEQTIRQAQLDYDSALDALEERIEQRKRSAKAGSR